MKTESTLAAAKSRAATARAEFDAAISEVKAHPGKRRGWRECQSRAGRAAVEWGEACADLRRAEIEAGVRRPPRQPVYSWEIVAHIQLTATAARHLSAVVRADYPQGGLAGLLADGLEGVVSSSERFPSGRSTSFGASLHVAAELRRVGKMD